MLATMVAAQAEFASGRADAFAAMWSRTDDVTVFGAFGSVARGWAEVGPRLEWAASHFSSGYWDYEPISSVFGADVGYTVWMERGEADGDPLRVTHVFRLEDDQWKIVHRHADPLVDVDTTWLMVREDR
jgi:ketosteroid isomerase-like protein